MSLVDNRRVYIPPDQHWLFPLLLYGHIDDVFKVQYSSFINVIGVCFYLRCFFVFFLTLYCQYTI